MARLSAGHERSIIMNQEEPLRRRRTTGESKFYKLFRNQSTYQSDEVSQLLAGMF